MPQIDIDGANSRLSADNIRGQSGSTITIVSGHNLVGSGSGLTALPAANLTGTIAAISGANLTNLNATNLASGTVPTARLGSGTANSSVHLRGDGTWTTAGVTPKMKMLHTTYAFSGAPGTQTLSGVGFAPDAIFGMWGVGNSTYKTPNIFWAINSSSSLAQSGTRAFNAWRHNERSTAGSWMWANAGMQWIDSHNDYVQGTVTTWGSDGITITYTVTGSPTTSQTMNQSTVYFKLT